VLEEPHVTASIARSSRLPGRHRHPVNQAAYDDAPLGARIADGVTGFMGSWRFIVVQTVIVVIWISGNVYEAFNFDPFPFILLNLAFSTQAAYAAPLILLAGNRSAARDRMTLEHAASEADIEDQQNRELLEGNHAILERVQGLEQTILRLERSILAGIVETNAPEAGDAAGADAAGADDGGSTSG
jgi:uncharacterized membrane protein